MEKKKEDAKLMLSRVSAPSSGLRGEESSQLGVFFLGIRALTRRPSTLACLIFNVTMRR